MRVVAPLDYLAYRRNAEAYVAQSGYPHRQPELFLGIVAVPAEAVDLDRDEKPVLVVVTQHTHADHRQF